MMILSASGFIDDAIRSSSCDLGFLLRCFLLRVFINASPGFPAQAAFLDVTSQQRIGAVLFAERAVQVLENLEPNVQADEIAELEGPHRVIQAQFHRFVDIFGSSDARFEHVESFVSDQRVDARGDKTRGFVHDYNFLAHTPRYFPADGDCFFGTMRRSYKFDQLHLRDWIEEVHADAAIA